MDRNWKLGDDLSEHDNMLDGFTFADVILAVHCNCRSITPNEVRKTAKEIIDQRMQDFEFLLDNNMKEIMSAAKKGRGGYEN